MYKRKKSLEPAASHILIGFIFFAVGLYLTLILTRVIEHDRPGKWITSEIRKELHINI